MIVFVEVNVRTDHEFDHSLNMLISAKQKAYTDDAKLSCLEKYSQQTHAV